jgi:GNAT superfamily N-acetyltransferase
MSDDILNHVEVRNVKYEELEQFWNIQQEYLNNWTLVYLKDQYNEYSPLFVAAFINNSMCGIAYGSDYDEKTITLQGIAVLHKYWSCGIGSKLLKFFETKVAKIKITIGAASSEFVERFYLKNGYKPKQFLIRIKCNQIPIEYEQKKRNFHVIKEKSDQENDAIMLYIEMLEYDNNVKDNVKKIFNAYEAIYIMEKTIPRSIS